MAVGIAVHEAVLVKELLALLAPGGDGIYVDATLGNAGHALAVLETTGPKSLLLGIDRDSEILSIAGERLKPFLERVRLIQDNFSNLGKILAGEKIGKADGIYLDLGVSSLQLDKAERGFSFRKEGPIDMRMDPTQEENLLRKMHNSNEEELTRVLREYGEERCAARIAGGLLEKLGRGELRTTLDIAEVAFQAYPVRFRHGRTHPATRTFQALRIWTNGEIEALRIFLEQAPFALKVNGRLCVISYHSLEDRLVKHAFRDLAKNENFGLLTKKPIVPTEEEIQGNPRARSAKLRGLIRHH